MSRLIDTDSIHIEKHTSTGDVPYDQGFDAGIEHVLEAMCYAPTIDAIPVEWLREKIKEHTDEEGWQDYLANSFGLCIEEWQKEQEAQDG